MRIELRASVAGRQDAPLEPIARIVVQHRAHQSPPDPLSAVCGLDKETGHPTAVRMRANAARPAYRSFPLEGGIQPADRIGLRQVLRKDLSRSGSAGYFLGVGGIDHAAHTETIEANSLFNVQREQGLIAQVSIPQLFVRRTGLRGGGSVFQQDTQCMAM